jgi:hypothetical protein
MALSDTISSESKPPSRGSSPRSSACHRPKLMRSSATAPCLATSNACRNDLAYLHSTSRATALLSRVASYSTSRPDRENKLRPPQENCCRSASPRGGRTIRDLSDSPEEQKKNIYTGEIALPRECASSGHNGQSAHLSHRSTRTLLQLSKLRGFSGRGTGRWR